MLVVIQTSTGIYEGSTYGINGLEANARAILMETFGVDGHMIPMWPGHYGMTTDDGRFFEVTKEENSIKLKERLLGVSGWTAYVKEMVSKLDSKEHELASLAS